MGEHRVAAPRADILIVDDTPANLRLLSRMLTEQGYQARPVPDGPLALAAARAKPPDLILLDIRMPGMSGYEVCEQLKANSRTCDVPIIFVSAMDATEDKIRAFTAGGVDYVTKPFQFEEVLARVETHLALQRLQRRLQDANRKMAQELALAGEVQFSFLPRSLPDIAGWQVAAALEPARETSGDFYDFIHLPEGRLGIVMADVSDKGAAAAMYMALSCTLIRTYAMEQHRQPERVLSEVNRRLLADTESYQFVTMVYGILDPESGTLSFCNAGHNSPYLFRRGAGVGETDAVQALGGTGPALGILPDQHWEQEAVQLAPGDVLVLYTDGITEARNSEKALFEDQRLLEAVKACVATPSSQTPSAEGVQAAILAAVHRFVGDAPQSDDITLSVIVRDRRVLGSGQT
jgi:sigma-B regulation protein RsbU (phosphoserine phosphatase)